jgi:hypothetical protein
LNRFIPFPVGVKHPVAGVKINEWMGGGSMTRVMWQDAERILARVPEKNGFHCADGKVIRSLQELENALATMSGDTFARHVSAERNDFAVWVRDVLGDAQLAQEIDAQRNRSHSSRSIARRIFFLRSQIA